MSIMIADNFSYLGQKPLDARIKYATIADMVSTPAADVYDGCFAYVTAEKKYYSYDSANPVDVTLGKWKEYESGGGADNVIDGYRNAIDGLFYEESTFTTAIAGASNTLYVDLLTNDIYRWDGTAFVIENTRSKDISYADFSVLPQADKDNGTIYFVPDAEIVTGFTVMGNRFDKANIYTTTERMVGSWMGKPLYQRVWTGLSVNLPASSTNWVTVVADSPVDVDIYVSGVILSDNDKIMLTPTAIGGAADKPGGGTDGVSIICNSHRQRTITSLILQYTKTTDAQVNIGTPFDYSTDEMIVGTWVDNRPIYQKTVNLGNIASGNIPHGISDLDVAIWYGGFATNGVTSSTIPYVHSGAWSLTIDISKTDIAVQTSTQSWSAYTGMLTIQYVKTTD